MRLTSAVKAILIINLVFYALTYWITPMFLFDGYSDWFKVFNVLHPMGSSGFAVYQYITYMFMHGGWWHLFFNMWSLMIFGCAVEQALGTRRFWTFYLLSGIGAAAVHQIMAALGIIAEASLVGASGAIFGVMAAAAFLFPEAKIFIIPIPFPVKLKYLVGFYTVAEMYMGLTGVTSDEHVAHFAHLGGLLAGVLILLWWRRKDKRQASRGDYWTMSDSYSSASYNKGESAWSKLKESMFGKKKPKMRVVSEAHASESNADDHAYNERRRRENAQIDLILDKIRKSGYQSLSEEEKAMLFQVSQRK